MTAINTLIFLIEALEQTALRHVLWDFYAVFNYVFSKHILIGCRFYLQLLVVFENKGNQDTFLPDMNTNAV